MLSLKQGSGLVALARKSISYYFASGILLSETPFESSFKEKQGCFVSLHSFPKNELKGCVGFPLPVMPLWQACIQASVSAAFEDSRFSVLKISELSKTLIEVSVLSKPEELKCKKEELPEKVKVGKHGLIVSKGFNSGLLLPQVAQSFNWSSAEFLEQCCLKAGLPSDSWKKPSCKIETFEAQVFKEETPEGKVVEEKLC
jgi:hypothetical protein